MFKIYVQKSMFKIYEIQLGAKFNIFFAIFKQILRDYIGHQHHNTVECDVGD